VSPAAQIGVLCGVAIALIALAVWIVLRVAQRNPEKRERRRRLQVNLMGRLGDALITEVNDQTLYYSYSVNGVEYSASQDVGSLRDRLPTELGRVIGMAHLKYTPRNPANSILVCEEWSGLREKSAAAG